MHLSTRSADGTRTLGRRLGALLRGLDLVCLFGELGSGKTTFTQGLARAVGCRGRVTSPTFVLARVYPGKRWRVNHLDLYRVGDGSTRDIGIEDYLADPRGICVVEWPEAGRDYLRRDRLEVRFSHGEEGERRIVFKALGRRAREILSGFKGRRNE